MEKPVRESLEEFVTVYEDYFVIESDYPSTLRLPLFISCNTSFTLLIYERQYLFHSNAANYVLVVWNYVSIT